MADNYDLLTERYNSYRRVLGLRNGTEYGVRLQYGAATAQCATAMTTTENLFAAYSGLCAMHGYEPKPDDIWLSFLNLGATKK